MGEWGDGETGGGNDRLRSAASLTRGATPRRLSGKTFRVFSNKAKNAVEDVSLIFGKPGRLVRKTRKAGPENPEGRLRSNDPGAAEPW
jgi:hypothetical protein